jgi:predicted AlkP superfamily phosphohydrolase/phosphomutase
VIGLDGATFDVLDPMFEKGLLPNLASLASRGVRADLETVVPVTSPPAWTSATTGVNPGKHNIFDFFHASKSSEKPLLTSSLDRRARPVWQLLNEKGIRTGIMNIPMTFPPEKVDGFFISGFPYGAARSGFTYPPELEKELGNYPLDPFGEGIEPGREGELLRLLRNTLEVHAKTALRLMKEKDWDLFWVVFTGTDKVQHFYWKFQDPEHPLYDPALAAVYGSAIRDVFVKADGIVGEFVEAAGPNADVIVVSDHGFGPIYYELRLANWLREEGFLQAPSAERPAVVEAVSPGPFGGMVRVNQAGRDYGGQIPRAEASEVRERLVERLRALRDPRSAPFVEKVFLREEVFSGPYVENAPDVLFLERPFGFVGRRPVDSADAEATFGSPSYTFSAFHRPNALLIAAGPHFPVNRARVELSILDLAPTIYWLFDVALPPDLDGEVPEALIGKEALATRPARMGVDSVVVWPGETQPGSEGSREELDALPYVR